MKGTAKSRAESFREICGQEREGEGGGEGEGEGEREGEGGGEGEGEGGREGSGFEYGTEDIVKLKNMVSLFVHVSE